MNSLSLYVYPGCRIYGRDLLFHKNQVSKKLWKTTFFIFVFPVYVNNTVVNILVFVKFRKKHKIFAFKSFSLK